MQTVWNKYQNTNTKIKDSKVEDLSNHGKESPNRLQRISLKAPHKA